MKMQKKSLADKINALITSKPVHFDSDEEPEETKAKVVEYHDDDDISDNEFRQSKIRRQNIDTLDKVDKRYAGKKISRKDMYSEDDEDDEEEDEEDEEDISKDMESKGSEEAMEKEEMDGTLEESSDESQDKGTDSQEGSEGAESEESEEDYDVDLNNPLYKKRDSTIKTMSETNARVEMEKGNCVRNQLRLWENLLEVRIKLQKCVVVSNQMPQYDTHKELRSDASFAKEIDETKNKLTLLLDNMLRLKELLLKQYPETNNLHTNSKKRKAGEDEDDKDGRVDDPMDEEISSDTEDEADNGEGSSANEETKPVEGPTPRKRLKNKNYEHVLREDNSSYTEYRDSVIKKWNEKTRITTMSKSAGQTTLKQVGFAMSDIGKLRSRTRLKRSEYGIVGKSLPLDDNDGRRRTQEYDPEIYDDDDFYHQLLRDLIAYKSADVTDPIQLSKQWIQLQNMRNKMKRRIDTHATKGRRVRYNVHDKLVNFMTPIAVYDTWTDSAKNELYNSLFGKIKSSAEEQANE
ncbi:PREDICTED: protein AATF [Dinoponera quadriceps]|uniref:Protein AATF n=1 Tax=Dinoponera quadriceps TaxID=609295 RepID=A0A6P3WT49_DINQU|nr:PREDICTED: protein AATF [Dinoponera quadriceps]